MLNTAALLRLDSVIVPRTSSFSPARMASGQLRRRRFRFSCRLVPLEGACGNVRRGGASGRVISESPPTSRPRLRPPLGGVGICYGLTGCSPILNLVTTETVVLRCVGDGIS